MAARRATTFLGILVAPPPVATVRAIAGLATVATVLLAPTAPAASRLADRRGGIEGAQVRSSRRAYARALGIQADGKLIAVGSSDAAGQSGGFALARYTRNGSLDGSFGRGGKVLTNFGSPRGAAAVVIQPDGKIVAAGSSSRSADRRDAEFALARYRRDGSLDASFGSGGKVLTTFGRYSAAVGIVLQQDGKLVAVGSSGNDHWADGQLAVARYTRSGRLDASFGRGGKVLMSCGPCDASAVAIQPDGKIVVVGSFLGGLARFNVDGTLDPTFGRGGKVKAKPFHPPALGLAIQVDGQIVTAGYTEALSDKNDNHSSDFALAGYTPDGSLDPSFGSGGTVTTDFTAPAASFETDNVARAVAIQADGKLVAVGYDDKAGGYHPREPSEDVFALARYTPNASLDTSFGSGGKVLTSNGNWDSIARGVVIQPDGRIVAAGNRCLGAHPCDFLLVRYTAQGRLDGSFGNGGKVTTEFALH
jgi:uncharacterized delta-60 repeat protein